MLGVFTRDNPDAYKPLKMSNQVMNKLFEKDMLRVLRVEETRIDMQVRLVDICKSSKFTPDVVRTKQTNVKIFKDMELMLMGSGIEFPVSKKQEFYITIGKYKVHKTKLMGGKLKKQSYNNNQIHNSKSQNITKYT
jgi:hypothetical protein